MEWKIVIYRYIYVNPTLHRGGGIMALPIYFEASQLKQ